MARVLPVVLAVALIVYAFIDCLRTEDRNMPPGLPKPVWLALILLVPVIGALGWLLVTRLPTDGTSRPRRQRPVAPDDDPEFLANLDWEARKAHHERLRREKERQERESRGDVDDQESPPLA